MKVPSSLRPGIFVLLMLAIYAIPIRWIETRRLRPLDAPISISNGHFITGEFKINLSAVYVVNFIRPEDASPEYSGCDYQARIHTKWTVFKNGRLIAVSLPSTSTDYPWQRVDSFTAGPGTYSIDVEALPGAECLNFARMQLVVGAYDVDFSDTLNLLWGSCLFLGAVGAVLLIRVRPASFREQTQDQLRDRSLISQSPGYTRNFGLRKRRPMPRFHRLPDLGMLYFAAMFPCLIAMLILMHHSGSMGIKTHLVRPSGIHANADPRSKALLVWLDAHGNYFVNGKEVSRDNLEDAVKHELSQPAEWTVYFEADGNASFGDAAFAMGKIRNASGKLVWLTPKTRSEFSALKPAQ